MSESDSQTKSDIADRVGDVGETLLNEAILEPARESLRTRRRRAAFAAVVDELDDLISDVDDE